VCCFFVKSKICFDLKKNWFHEIFSQWWFCAWGKFDVCYRDRMLKELCQLSIWGFLVHLFFSWNRNSAAAIWRRLRRNAFIVVESLICSFALSWQLRHLGLFPTFVLQIPSTQYDIADDHVQFSVRCKGVKMKSPSFDLLVFWSFISTIQQLWQKNPIFKP